MTLFEQIDTSASMDDLDDALRPIQQMLGQDDGGFASAFFSNRGWPRDRAARMVLLGDYIAYELEMRQ